jgi:uncharacterized damage-inducible protein DinB
MIGTIRLFADYNRKANAMMMGILSALPEEAFTRNLGTFFKSIHDTLLHVAVADIMLLKRAHGFIHYACVADSEIIARTNEEIMGTCARDRRAVLALKEQIDALIVAYANEIKAEDLPRRFRYKNMRGEELERTYGHLVLHLFNHETHHRGAISAMLDILKIDNDYSGLTLYTD